MSLKVDSPVRLSRDTAAALEFKRPTLGSWIVLPIGLALTWFAATRFEDAVGRWYLAGLGAVLAVIAIAGILWRHEFRVDLMRRTYAGQRGFWPSTVAFSGPLCELQCIALERRHAGRAGGSSDIEARWVVQFELKGWAAPLIVFMSNNEQQAYERLDRFARKLSVPVVDRTGSREVRYDAGRDRREGLRGDADHETDASRSLRPPPEGSGIDWFESGGGATIQLPALGFGIGTLIIFALGAVLESTGALAILAYTGLIDVPFQGSALAAWLVGGTCVAIGGLLSVGGVLASIARETITEVRDGLRMQLVVGGFSYRNRFVAKRGIQEIAIKQGMHGVLRGREVVIRADTDIVRLGDPLDAKSQVWLRDTLQLLACR